MSFWSVPHGAKIFVQLNTSSSFRFLVSDAIGTRSCRGRLVSSAHGDPIECRHTQRERPRPISSLVSDDLCFVLPVWQVSLRGSGIRSGPSCMAVRGVDVPLCWWSTWCRSIWVSINGLQVVDHATNRGGRNVGKQRSRQLRLTRRCKTAQRPKNSWCLVVRRSATEDRAHCAGRFGTVTALRITSFYLKFVDAVRAR